MGVYNLRASVPSPYLNVICANVQKDEIKGLVYEAQPNVTLNATADLPTLFTTLFNWTSFSTVKTPVDDIFSWDSQHPPPIFYKYPKNFNTILNATAPWGRDSVYLLGLGAPDMLGDYIVCKAKGGLTPYCSTEYVATGSGGTMQAHCEDPKDDMAFVRSNSSRIDTTSLDWFNVATTAITALSLGTGVTDGAASNARILTELILQDKYLNPSLPSPAEAIAVMAGCTLLMSAQDSPFVDFWVSQNKSALSVGVAKTWLQNYSSTSLTPGEHQVFNASIRAQQYASGGTLGYQRGFYIVLFAVFFTNIFVLIYFMINRGLVTDFSEPPNIFSLAINSPPSKVMGGACGGGPEGRQYTVKWGVQMEGEHLYIADKTNPLAGIYASGARSESRMSFADLISRWKWRQVDNPAGNSPDNIELGRSSTTYTGAGVDDEEEGPLRSGNTRKPDLSLGRMYSKISKRKSVL
jgi:hypothetical protein